MSSTIEYKEPVMHNYISLVIVVSWPVWLSVGRPICVPLPTLPSQSRPNIATQFTYSPPPPPLSSLLLPTHPPTTSDGGLAVPDTALPTYTHPSSSCSQQAAAPGLPLSMSIYMFNNSWSTWGPRPPRTRAGRRRKGQMTREACVTRSTARGSRGLGFK